MQNKIILHFDTGRSWRGGQNQVLILIKGLIAKGLDKQILLSPPGSRLQKCFKDSSVRILDLDPKNDIDIFSIFSFKRIIDKYSPDIVHLHTARALAVAAFSKKKGCFKTVFTRRVKKRINNNFLNQLKYSFPDIITAISDSVMDDIKLIRKSGVKRIYSSVDLSLYDTAKALNREVFKVAMISALDLHDKDIFSYIDSAEILIKNELSVPCRFYLLGSGPDKEKIEEYISKKKLGNNFVLQGFVEDIPAFLENIDLLVHTAKTEGLGTVILQSMAAHVPVIASSAGGIREIIENENNGYLLESSDPLLISSLISGLMKDRTKLIKLAQNARRTVESKFSAEKMVNKYIEVYEELFEK